MEEFLTGRPPRRTPDRVLATVLFTDIVGSTDHAAMLGDRAWHGLLDSHNSIVRERLDRFRGREVKTTGDGFVARFDGLMTGDQVRVGDCMHAGVVSCAADVPLAEVARIMGDHRVHVVAVADLGHGRPYGTWRLVSHMDVVAAIATGQDVLAYEVAATEANTVAAGDPLERAAQMTTEHAVSHLVVVDSSGGYPVGIISTLDVASAFGGSPRWGSNKKAV